MSHLLDTDVLSEMGRARPHPGVLARLDALGANALRVSVVTVGEIRRGVEAVRRARPQRAADLEAWLEGLVTGFGDRLVPIDHRVADRWGRLEAELRQTPIAVPDGLIAASALVHDWTLVTGNVRHFERTGVRVLNPFESR